MNYTFYELAMLFFTYSFLAWLAETAVAMVKVRNFRNRGSAVWRRNCRGCLAGTISCRDGHSGLTQRFQGILKKE